MYVFRIKTANIAKKSLRVRLFVEIFAIAAVMLITWMAWQLYRAKRFNRFKRQIITEVKPLVAKHVAQMLVESRDEQTPNTDAHIHACQYYWTQYVSRTLQAALHWQLIDEQWLKRTGNIRNCQHLFYIERNKLVEFNDKD